MKRSTHTGSRLLLALALFAAALLLAACSGGEDPPRGTPSSSPATASDAVTGTPSAQPSATRTVTPTGTPEPVEVLSTLLLIEVETGEGITLAEGHDNLWGEDFLEDSVVWGQSRDFGEGDSRRRADLDGHRLPPLDERCRGTATGVMLDDVAYEGIGCGPISPDGRFMAYTTETSEDGEFRYGYGVVNLEAQRAALLRDDLVHCGGCDLRYGPSWSRSGRYLVLSEFGGQGRIFLADTSTLNDRVLGEGNDRSQAPEWSPSEDALALSDHERTILIDPVSGIEREVPLPWPARWDSTGAYLYSLAWAAGGTRDTRVLDIATLGADTLPGTPPDTHLWSDAVGVVGLHVVGLQGTGYTAALEGAPGCDGVTITSTLAGAPRCIEDAFGAAISPDGSRVALAQFVGEVGPSGVPRQVIVRYRVVVLDVASGDENEVTDEVLGRRSLDYGGGNPPAITWNDAGTHILVRWPAAYGL